MAKKSAPKIEIIVTPKPERVLTGEVSGDLSVVGVHRSYLMIAGPLNDDDPQETQAVLYHRTSRTFGQVAKVRQFARFIRFRDPGEKEFPNLPVIPREIRDQLMG